MGPLFRSFNKALWLGLGIGIALGVAASSWDWSRPSWAQFGNGQPLSAQIAAGPESDAAGTSSRRLASPLPEAGELPLTPEEQISVRVYDVANRSVVHIATKTRMDTFLTVTTREGAGSGSVIDDQGHILTNHHVIEGAREVTVSLHNGTSYPAVLIGQDAETDIAVLKIDAPAKDLQPLAWGDSSNLRVGQRIYAIGNPFGLERTMSTGIISSLNRQIPAGGHRTMRSLIQLDISLNQGNSGGPLLNTRGELIGMNTAIMSTNGDSAGVGFAIPVSTIRRIVPQLVRDGHVVRPTIGITRVYENDGGLLIVSVAAGGPAEKAGLRGFALKTKNFRQGPFRYEQSVVDPQTADLITAADGKPVRTADELLAIIESREPGSAVTLTILRDGKQQSVRVTLGSSDATTTR
ncbi:MAG: S1C family serine protease [Aureliella sp.]